jgi:hypothetical protein
VQHNKKIKKFPREKINNIMVKFKKKKQRNCFTVSFSDFFLHGFSGMLNLLHKKGKKRICLINEYFNHKITGKHNIMLEKQSFLILML